MKLQQMNKVNNTNIVIYSVISSFFLYVLSFAPYGGIPKIVATLSSFIVFFLLWDFILNRRLSMLYILPFITLNWLYFQSPFILKEKTEYYNRIIKDEYVDEIAIYCGISVYLIFLGYRFFFNGIHKSLTSKSLRFKDDVLVKVIYLFVVLGVMFRFGQSFSPQLISKLSNLIQLLPYSATIVFGFYLLMIFRRKEKKQIAFLDILVILFLSSDFLIRLSTTLFSEVVSLFYGPVLVYVTGKRKLPVIPIAVALLILLPLYQTRKYFRLHWEDVKEFKGSELSKGKLLMENAYTLDDQRDYQELQERGKDFNRFENLSFISHVVLQHKKGLKPFLYGETFYWLPLVPIPRILYPSKPKNVMSSDLATSYGLRGTLSIASINFPMLVEGYINYGFKGMMFMALLFGIAYKWFTVKFGFGLGDVNLIIIINSIKQFTHAEGNITLVFGALIQVFLFWAVIAWFFKLNNKNKKLFDVE